MKNNSILISFIIILFCNSKSFAQNGFLKFGDVKGESTERTHQDWINIESFKIGILPPKATTGISRNKRKPLLENLIITKKLDKSTPVLMEICTDGKVTPKLVLEMLSDDGKLYYRVTLSNVKVYRINTSTVCEPNCKLLDKVTFSYTKITWEYWDNDGNKTEGIYSQPTGA